MDLLTALVVAIPVLFAAGMIFSIWGAQRFGWLIGWIVVGFGLIVLGNSPAASAIGLLIPLVAFFWLMPKKSSSEHSKGGKGTDTK